jgi:hypothetical protein
MSQLQCLCAREISPVACTIRSRKSAPPISGMATICSGFEWTGTTMPSVQRDNICHDLELGAAMWGITADSEAQQAIAGDTRSDDESETGLGNTRVGLKYRPAVLAFSGLCPGGCAGQPLGPFVDLKTRSFESGLSYPYAIQDTMSGPHVLGRGHTGPNGMSWNFGSSGTDGNTLEPFHGIGSPYHIDSRGLFDREHFSSALGLTFHAYLSLCAPGQGDTSTCHPSASPPPSPAVDHRMERIILQSVPFELEASWPTPVGRCVPDKTAQGLRGRSGLSVKKEHSNDQHAGDSAKTNGIMFPPQRGCCSVRRSSDVGQVIGRACSHRQAQ